jgi:hypothetical protein
VNLWDEYFSEFFKEAGKSFWYPIFWSRFLEAALLFFKNLREEKKVCPV